MSIFDFVQKQIKNYEKPIELIDGWSWSMKEHLRKSFLYKNSQFFEENENRELRPFVNILLPILNFQYRNEGFDVKDILLYVDNPDEFYKSLIVNKYHDQWTKENAIDEFIDDVVESYCDYGGVLVKKSDNACPIVVDLQSLAFCDQSDILKHPFGIKHILSFSELKKWKDVWNFENGATIDIDELIDLAKKEGKDKIEVYEIHGIFEGENQAQIISFYKKDEKNIGVFLFKKKEPQLPFKFLKRDKISGRALGRGAIEELFEAQVWTNWNAIKVIEMLEAASKIIFKTTDQNIASRHSSGLKDLDNLEIIQLQEGKHIGQIDTTPRSLVLFNNAIDRFEILANKIGATNETLLGESPSSGTPFKLYEAQQIESKSMHRFRQGKIAVFIDEIYREWILPYFEKEIVNEKFLLVDFSADELERISENIAIDSANEIIKKAILEGKIIDYDIIPTLFENLKTSFLKSGSKKFVKILKNELKDLNLKISINIANKQKDLALITDKLVNVFRQVIAAPQILQDPNLAKVFNKILEYSGISPLNFSPSIPLKESSTQPLEKMANTIEGERKELIKK